jgi:hypothetical protein
VAPFRSYGCSAGGEAFVERRTVFAMATIVCFAVVATLAVALDYNGARGGFLPLGLGGLAFGASLVAWQCRLAAVGSPRRLLVLGSLLVQGVLLSMTAFFLAVAAGNAVGSHALRHTDGGLADVATLLGSVEIMIALPVGLLALAVALGRDRTAPRPLRVLPAVAVVVFALAPVLVGTLPDTTEQPVMVGWLAAITATWIALARALAPALAQQVRRRG